MDKNLTELGVFDSVDELLTAFGSTWALDHINIYPFTFFGIVGLFLNLFGLLVFVNSRFQLQLYKYMRVYSLVNALICLFSSFWFINISIRVFPFTNSYWTQVLSVKVLLPLTNLLYFYSGCLDVLILVERISQYNVKVKQFFKLSPYVQCIIFLVVCTVLDFAYFWFYDAMCQTLPVRDIGNYTICFYKDSQFTKSTLGQFFTFFLIALRDVILLLVIIILNIYLNWSFKKFMLKKASSTTSSSTPATPSGSSSPEKKLIIMVTVVCFLTIIEHALVILSILVSYVAESDVILQLIFLDMCALFWPIKRCLDFLIYAAFNYNFRRTCITYLKRGIGSSQ